MSISIHWTNTNYLSDDTRFLYASPRLGESGSGSVTEDIMLPWSYGGLSATAHLAQRCQFTTLATPTGSDRVPFAYSMDATYSEMIGGIARTFDFLVAASQRKDLTSAVAYWNVRADNFLYSAENDGRVYFVYGIYTRRNLITLNANGGSLPSGTSATIEVKYNATYGTLPTPTYGSRAFLGWFTDPVGGTQVTSSTRATDVADSTIYAHWDAGVQHTVLFDANGGAFPAGEPDQKVVTVGDPYGTLPTPVRTGFVFDGWFTDPTAGTQITSETIVPAVPPSA